MRDGPLELACAAKLNVALSVGGPDAERGGLHPIASWMVALRHADRLVLRPAAAGRSRFDIAFAGAPHEPKVDWPLHADLAHRAHGLMCARSGRALDVELTLRKRIPPGSGLGGGSSDAAATLVGLNRLFDLGVDDATLCAWGHTLGSDVAFGVAAMLGSASAIVSGLGERIEPAPLRRPLHVVLVFPPFACPTGAVYRAHDAIVAPATAPDVDRVRALAAAATVAPDGPFNDLAQAAAVVQPQLGALRCRLAAELAAPVHVSGSGSTLFLLAAGDAEARALAERAAAASGLPVVATRTI